MQKKRTAQSHDSAPRLWYVPVTVSGRRRGSTARLASAFAALGLAFVAAASAAGPGTSERQRADSLKRQEGSLASQTRSAVLDLYALDSRLGTAQARLASLQTQAAQLRVQQALLAQQIAATQHTLVISQQQLGANLRLLYKQDDTDALAVMLGAHSLSEGLTRIDDLNSVTDQSERVVSAARDARTHLVGLRHQLSVRRVQVVADLDAAQRTAVALASARAGRLSFVSRLRNEQQLKAAQVRALEARAQAAELKSEQLQAAAAASPAAPATPVGTTLAPTVSTPSATTAPTTTAPEPGGHTLTVSSTGYSLPGHTATGLPVGWGIVAVDPSVIPLGTRLTIPGYGDGVAADTGSAVRGADIDLWFPTLAQALAWGRRTVTITIH